MRTVEDDHVDRPGVDVQQCMKLTGTNRSIELDRSHCPCSSQGEGFCLRPDAAKAKPSQRDDHVLSSRCRGFAASAHGPRAQRWATRSALARPKGLGHRHRASTPKTCSHPAKTKAISGSPLTAHHSPEIQLLVSFALSRPGGSGGVAAPVPIPNTAVKRPSAYGTSS